MKQIMYFEDIVARLTSELTSSQADLMNEEEAQQEQLETLKSGDFADLDVSNAQAAENIVDHQLGVAEDVMESRIDNETDRADKI
eukprot:9718344-Heterocapsa_arctica.AAC.1